MYSQRGRAQRRHLGLWPGGDDRGGGCRRDGCSPRRCRRTRRRAPRASGHLQRVAEGEPLHHCAAIGCLLTRLKCKPLSPHTVKIHAVYATIFKRNNGEGTILYGKNSPRKNAVPANENAGKNTEPKLGTKFQAPSPKGKVPIFFLKKRSLV